MSHCRFHRFLDLNGLDNNWRGEHLENLLLVNKDESIGSFSGRAGFGAGVLEAQK